MVDILLSTYNGEKYLAEQIDSILSQTYTSWRLLIRDDGSMDNTHTIIQEYVDKYSEKIVWINKGEVSNIGVIKSFEVLMQASTAPYFMFCDQDDVWLSFKIEETLKQLLDIEKTIGKDKPILVHTDLQVVDKDLLNLYPSFYKLSGFNPKRVHSNKHYALMYNCVTGCTVMGNKTVINVSLPIENWADMHDSWVTRKVLLNDGKVITIYKQTMLYRQHGNNVLGSNNKLTCKGRLLYLYSVFRQYKKLLKINSFLAILQFLYWRCIYRL